MGRTKSKPAHRPTITCVLSNPTFSYFSAPASNDDGTPEGSAVGQNSECFRNASLTFDDREPLSVVTEPSSESDICTEETAETDNEMGDLMQSQQVLVLIEPKPPSIEVTSTAKETAPVLDQECLPVAVNCVICDMEGEPVATTNISVCRISLASKLYCGTLSLSIYHLPDDAITLSDQPAIGALLSLCFLLCLSDAQLHGCKDPIDFRRRLFEMRQDIRPILTACSQGLLSVVITPPERSNLQSSSSHYIESTGTPDIETRHPPTKMCESIQVDIQLTPAALAKCNPTVLHRSPPLPTSSQGLVKPSSYPASILREALAVMFPHTLVADVAENPNPDERKSNGSSFASTLDGPITAKMIYDVVDNARLQEVFSSTVAVGDEAQQSLDTAHQSTESGCDEAQQSSDSARQNLCSGKLGLKIPGLNPTLRPYQEAAVRWMISREKSSENSMENLCWQVGWVVLDATRHTAKPLYECSTDLSDLCLYCPFAGWICTSMEEARSATLGLPERSETPSSLHNRMRGGILAESMGLGKTVEVLACILGNRCPDGFPHTRPNHDDIEIDTEKQATKRCTESTEVIDELPLCVQPYPDEADVLGSVTKRTMYQKLDDREKHTIECNGVVGDISEATDHSESASAQSDIKVDQKFGSNRKDKAQFSKRPNDSACICGREDSFKGCLGWVRCSSCGEFMHGLCAGFEFERQIKALPEGVWCSESRCHGCVAVKHSCNPINSRATLIITPPSILEQWQREIRRHVNDQNSGFKVVVYPGIRDMCATGKVPDVRYSHVRNLVDADIVLTTFQALMADLHRSGEHSAGSEPSLKQRSLRKRKRYRVMPSPLPSIRFWRCCLDEAQRVEAPTAASAKMALNLVAVNKWCVTGTPIGRGKLEDLYGLLLFLGLLPFRERRWFKHCFHSAHRGVIDRISFMLRDIFWRSTKANALVREQMGVPDQVENKIFLKFSSTEKHFYRMQLEETILAASKVAEDYQVVKSDAKRSKKVKGDELLLSAHLHRLRAACCHPQVGSGGLGRIGGRTCGVASIAAGVLTMEQILDRLIDDAKTKCEEAQRIAVMHSNALACLCRLKVEARNREDCVNVTQSDDELLRESARIYTEALELTKENALPCDAVGESVVKGCVGFLGSGAIIRSGSATLKWQLKHSGGDEPSSPSGNHERAKREIWAKFDFEGPAKKLTAIKVRTLASLPDDYPPDAWKILLPRKCVLQVSNASVGGEFVDVCAFELPGTVGESLFSEWMSAGGFRTNKSKSWRIVIKSYHPHHAANDLLGQGINYFVAIEVQLQEPEIGTDDLQRVHITHNAALMLSSILQLNENAVVNDHNGESNRTAGAEDIEVRLHQMQAESAHLEQLYLDSAVVVHRESRRQLECATQNREQIEKSMIRFLKPSDRNDPTSAAEDVQLWWRDFLSWCHANERDCSDEVSSSLQNIRDCLYDNADFLKMKGVRSLPDFRDLNGLHVALSLRVQEHMSAKDSVSVINKVMALPERPSGGEILENSLCRKCREDWFQMGPVCRHCKLEDELVALMNQLTDPLCVVLFRCIGRNLREINWVDKADPSYISLLRDKAKVYFRWQESSLKELYAAKLMWKTHFNLLSDIDELNQCKNTMRLLHPGESLSSLSLDQLNAVVTPLEIPSLFCDHQVKQAMAMSQLRRGKDTLRYLRNQSVERKLEAERLEADNNSLRDDNDAPTCVVCLCAFDGDRAVLSCGHCFHYSPCLEQLVMRSGGGSTISCPMRCNVRTNKGQIMIASEMSKNDGSRIEREVIGSWGTKVERIVGDLLDVIDMGEKSILFSQWEDLLAIVEQALIANQIQYIRPKSRSKVGACAKMFRGGDIPVLLLNVKSGAEGLTLVEATHVFMVEPLLHCGMDAQAINRVHRIGQTSKTYVHRYIIDDTIELKIDKLRMEKQLSHENDDLEPVSRNDDTISAGGIDGGFSASELQEILK